MGAGGEGGEGGPKTLNKEGLFGLPHSLPSLPSLPPAPMMVLRLLLGQAFRLPLFANPLHNDYPQGCLAWGLQKGGPDLWYTALLGFFFGTGFLFASATKNRLLFWPLKVWAVQDPNPPQHLANEIRIHQWQPSRETSN